MSFSIDQDIPFSDFIDSDDNANEQDHDVSLMHLLIISCSFLNCSLDESSNYPYNGQKESC